MSVRVSTWAWKQPIGASAKLVLLALADQANDVGTCWPFQSTLASKCGISERTLQTHLASLEAGGYLRRERRHRRDGARTSDMYTLGPGEDLAGGGVDQPQISRDLPAESDRPKAKNLRPLKAVEPSRESSGESGRRRFAHYDGALQR